MHYARFSVFSLAVWTFCALAACDRRGSFPGTTQAAAAPASGAAGQQPQRELVTAEPVRMVDAPTNEFLAPARLEVSPNYVAHVTAPLPGRMTAVFVHLGDAVTKGQPLLEIESPDTEQAESEFRSSTALISQAEASLAKAESDQERLSDLFQHNAIAQKEIVTARAAVAQFKAAVEQARATRDQASRKLEIHGLKPGSFRQRVIVRAPLAGKILEMNIVAGEYRNDTAATLLRIADLSRLWVSSEVPEGSIRFCRAGGRVQLELIAYPDEKIAGTINYIADTVDPDMRTIKVRADIDNSSGRFRPDMFGRAHFYTNRVSVAWVPEKAVIHSNGREIVFVEDKAGEYKPREVVVGSRLDNGMVISSGLTAKDRVVVDGAIYLARADNK